MPLTSLKRSEVEQNGGTLLGEQVDATTEEYHYGLRIMLEEAELRKLELNNLKVGKKVQIVGIVKVVSFAEEETGRRAELLLTDLGFMQDPGEAERTEIMYKAE